ncbi:hypothetical protein D3C72_2246970 [compost metagenome]
MGHLRPYRSAQAGGYLGLAQWARFGAAAVTPDPEADPTSAEAGPGAPALGEHSREILSTLGYTSDEVAQLMQSAVVK